MELWRARPQPYARLLARQSAEVAHAERLDTTLIGRAPDAERHVEPVGNVRSPAAIPSRNGRWAR